MMNRIILLARMSNIKSIFFIQCLLLACDAFFVPFSRQTSCSPSLRDRPSLQGSNRVLHETEIAEAMIASDLSANVNDDNKATTPATTTTTPSSIASKSKLDWMERARQLYAFQQINGHTRVPKRYKDIPGLGNWVIKQRQHYRHYLSGDASPLTERRIEILNQLEFCWETTNIDDARKLCSCNDGQAQKSHDWWEHFYQCKQEYEQRTQLHEETTESTHKEEQLASLQALLDLSTRQSKWLREQQNKYSDQALTDSQVEALCSVTEHWYMTRRELAWEIRFLQLQQYKHVHGHCCVPISYSNKQLANWVSNQRKQYNLRQRAKPTDLTADRLKRLQSIGFVWNRWEYEYQKQLDIV